MKIDELRYITMACRSATDEDDEVDFIQNGESLVIVAIEVCGKDGIGDAIDKVTDAFPSHQIITTHTPLFSFLETSIEIVDLEKEIGSSGIIVSSVIAKDSYRLVQALNWEKKIEVVPNSVC